MDPAFKERVTAAFDGLAARYDTDKGGFFGPVSDLLVRPGGVFTFSWNVAEDPDWIPVIAAVDAYDVRTRQQVAEVRYPSPDAWWAASWNQAPALFWATIPERDLRTARARAEALLEPLRAPDGSLRRRLGFCYTRARRP